VILPEKLFSIYEHRVLKRSSPLVRGFDDRFFAPHSRYTTVPREEIIKVPELEIIAESDDAGVYLVKSTDSRRFFVFGHPEYDTGTLAEEYFRDFNAGLGTALPVNYFPDDDPWNEPLSTWCAHAQLLYTNWLNYYVYQSTPYEVERAGEE